MMNHTTTPNHLRDKIAPGTIAGIDYMIGPDDGCIWITAPNGAMVRLRYIKGALEMYTIDSDDFATTTVVL